MELRLLKKVIIIGLLINILILIVNFCVFKQYEFFYNQNQPIESLSRTNDIEVWSKAAIGDYFWKHILKGEIQKNLGDGYYRFGKQTVKDLVFKFRSGYSITPTTLVQFIKEKNEIKFNLILILNGRTKSSAQISESFICSIDQFKDRLNLGIILLGNEYCFNSWIKKYLDSGLIKFLFVVYDWNQINNVNIFQWPLGVATYRNFDVQINKDLIKNERNYLCNYVATIYRNSSREELLNLLDKSSFKDKCLIKVRMEWAPQETNESLESYENALRNSDLTLSPLGQNHECYRIYEAFSYLSIPILEENLNHVKGKRSNCDQKSSYRLLKEFNAPVRFVSNWTEDLNRIILDELMNQTIEQRMDKRIKIYNWYERFKSLMGIRFMNVLREKFFNE